MLIETKTHFTFDDNEKQAVKTVVNCLKEIGNEVFPDKWDIYASECLTRLYWFMTSTPDGEKFWEDEIAD